MLCCPQCLRDAKCFFQRESVCLKDLSCVRVCRHASTPNHSSADGALHKPFATPSLAIGTCEVMVKPCGARRTISLTMCKRAHVSVNCGAHTLAKRVMFMILFCSVTRQTMRKKKNMGSKYGRLKNLLPSDSSSSIFVLNLRNCQSSMPGTSRTPLAELFSQCHNVAL